VEEYNPATDTWRTVASLPTAVAQFGITVAGGISTAEPLQLIHVVSGNTSSESAPSVANPNPVQRFQADPTGPGVWSAFSLPGLTLRRNHGAATVLRGVSSRVFVIGGQDAGGTVLDTVEEYQAQAVTVVATPHTSLPAPRVRFGIAGSLSTQQIYVIGGVDGTGADQTTVFEYSVANNGPTPGPAGTPSGAWVTRGNLSAARRGLQVSTPPGVVNFLPVANTGRNAAQDALAEFVRLRLRPAKAPVPATDPGAQAGRTLFGTVGLVQPGFSCATCHGGANWTRSIVDYTAPPSPEIGIGLGNQRVIGAELRQTATQPNSSGPIAPPQAPGVLVNVGTFTLGSGRVNEIRFNGADISQAIAPLGANGFNIPSLLSLHETAPYFYSGLAQTLNQVLDGSSDGNGGTQQHFVANSSQRDQLIAFLRSIDNTTPIFAGAPGDTIIDCSSNILVECTGGLTPVTFTVTAANANGPVPVTCVPPSGTGFRIGTSNVVCTANGATTNCNFTVTVRDTTPPTLTCNSNQVVDATSSAGAVVTYFAGAFDACGIGSFNCLPQGGTTFPIGLTTVTCTALDSVGNSNSCSFTVTVNDTRPVITCSTNIIAECTGGLTPVTFIVTAVDVSGTPVPVTCVPPSGTGFRIGTSNVVCTATDVQGRANSCSFTVTVQDTTQPAMTCNSNVMVDATSPAGTVVTYIAAAFDACGIAAFDCAPQSGSTFPIGMTTVTCTALDSVGNSNSCSFEVSVSVPGARGIKENVLADLIALRATVTDKDDGEELDEAIEALTESLDPGLWVDQNHLERKHGEKVFDKEKESVKELCELIGHNDSHLHVATLQGFIDRMFQADRLLATTAIEEAAAAGVAKKKLDQARKELAQGDADAADSKCGNGIEHYKNAWKNAVHAKASPPAHLVTGQHQLEILGEPGERLTIQASVNMVDWVTLGTCTLDGEGVATFVDTDATRYAVRYYRIVKP